MYQWVDVESPVYGVFNPVGFFLIVIGKPVNNSFLISRLEMMR